MYVSIDGNGSKIAMDMLKLHAFEAHIIKGKVQMHNLRLVTDEIQHTVIINKRELRFSSINT